MPTYTPEEKALFARRVRERRHAKKLTMVEVPIRIRDWFKEYAMKDGTSMVVAITAALEWFIDKEEGRG